MFVLDACAMIAFLNDEEGAEIVESLLHQAMLEEIVLLIHEMNLLEIYYGVYREEGVEVAQESMERVEHLPIEVVHGLSQEVFHAAGRLKACYRISLADAICAAEAKVRKCALVTADHHEFDVLDSGDELDLLWIR